MPCACTTEQGRRTAISSKQHGQKLAGQKLADLLVTPSIVCDKQLSRHLKPMAIVACVLW